MKKILLVLGLSLTTIPTTFAGSVDMTCAQARDHYARHGRIYVLTGMGDVVPIYGLASRCSVGFRRSAYWVHASDNFECVIGYRCRYDRSDREQNRDNGRSNDNDRSTDDCDRNQ